MADEQQMNVAVLGAEVLVPLWRVLQQIMAQRCASGCAMKLW